LPRAPEPALEWARFNLKVWLEVSDTYRRLKPDDRRLAVALFLWQSARGPIADVPLDLARAAQDDDTSRVEWIREVLSASKFKLVEGRWFNDKAMELYDAARAVSVKLSNAGKKGMKSRWGKPRAITTPITEVITPSSTSLSTSPSASAVVEQVSLFEPILPPAGSRLAREAAVRFLSARHMRLHGFDPSRSPAAPSRGMLDDATKRIELLVKQGFPVELLVSLPALVGDEMMPDGRTPAYEAMLKRDPFVLLRVDNAQGGKCHARRYEGQIEGMFLSTRQVAILRNLGTYEYVKSRGAKDKTDAR